MVEMWVWQRKRPPQGDRGLTDSPHHSGGIEVHMDSSPTRFTTPMRITLSLLSPAVGVVLLVAAGCSGSKVENTQPNHDVSPATEKAFVGRATWYGPGFYRNKTASGEILRRNTLTAAHGQLPLGTKVKLTREDTNKCDCVDQRSKTLQGGHNHRSCPWSCRSIEDR